MQFKLWNKEGCLMKTIEAKSFAKARAEFCQEFGGNYRISWVSEKKGNCYQNVRFPICTKGRRNHE